MKTLKGLLNLTRRNIRWILVGIILLLIAVGYYIFFVRNPYTTDAYVQGNWVQVAARVPGPVTQIYVKNNQHVVRGQALFEIDPTLRLLVVKQAESKLSTINNKLSSLQSDAVNPGSEVKKLKQKLNLLTTNDARREAIAALEIAKKKLEFSTVRASVNGTLSNFYIRKGSYVKAGQPLFSIVEDEGDWWVQANYLESELRRIQVGQSAKVIVSMYPSYVFEGKVEAIAKGISRGRNISRQNTLPIVEESINWVRLFSRFPVFIHIQNKDKKHPLRVGATAAVMIHVK